MYRMFRDEALRAAKWESKLETAAFIEGWVDEPVSALTSPFMAEPNVACLAGS